MVLDLVAFVGFLVFAVWMMASTARANYWFWKTYKRLSDADLARDRLAIYMLCCRMMYQHKNAWLHEADPEVAAAMKECAAQWSKKLSPALYVLRNFFAGGVCFVLLVFLLSAIRSGIAR